MWSYFLPLIFLLRQLCSSSAQARGKPRVKLLPARLALSLYSCKLLPISAALAFELYPMASECLRYWNYQSLIYETSSNRSYMYTMCVRGHSITTWTRRAGRGSKNVCFCPLSGYKNCPRKGGGKKGKIVST